MITLISNPAAGSGRAKKVEKKAEEFLQNRNLPYKILQTAYSGHATELAKSAAEAYRPGDLLLVIGGDGTLLESVRGVRGSDLPLAVVPAGTGNDFIKSVGLPADPEAALEQILSAKPRRIDAGELNGGLFLNECGAGFDVMVLDYAEKAKRRMKGLLPYLYGVIRTIFSYQPLSMTVTADGKTVFEGACLVVSVANGKYIGGGIPISPEADVQSGKLELVVMRACKRGRMLRYLPGLLKGKILTFEHTEIHCRAESVSIRAERPLRVNVDGEILNMSACDFTVLPQTLMIQI